MNLVLRKYAGIMAKNRKQKNIHLKIILVFRRIFKPTHYGLFRTLGIVAKIQNGPFYDLKYKFLASGFAKLPRNNVQKDKKVRDTPKDSPGL